MSYLNHIFQWNGIWQHSHFCVGNCSFVSGEAATAIWFVAVAIILPLKWRKPALIVALTLAFLLSFNRVAFGRHFLSDVLLAWGLTLLVIAVVHRVVVEHPPRWLANERLDMGEGLRTGNLTAVMDDMVHQRSRTPFG